MPKQLFITGFIAFFTSVLLAACLSQPIDKTDTMGWRCNTPKKGSGIITGFFLGWEQSPFQNQGDGFMPVEDYRCFQSMAQCQEWLRSMAYKNDAEKPDVSICTAH